MNEWKPYFNLSVEDREIVARRFGSKHEKPCKRPNVTTCAMWECQVANECRASPLALSWNATEAPLPTTQGD